VVLLLTDIPRHPGDDAAQVMTIRVRATGIGRDQSTARVAVRRFRPLGHLPHVGPSLQHDDPRLVDHIFGILLGMSSLSRQLLPRGDMRGVQGV
jgi:hypothetical protein